MTTETKDILAGAASTQVDPLVELVGDGKKFKDVGALAAAKIESDKFITQLQGELAGLRKELDDKVKAGDQGASVQALIERIEKATSSQNGNQPGTLTKEEIEKLVKEGVNTAQSEAVQSGNYHKSNAELLNYFKGDADKASQHLKARINQLGLSGDKLTELARTNPSMFRELFVPQARQHVTNDVTLPAGKSGALDATTERGRTYYSNLRKELGPKFWDTAIQQQMFRDRKQLGDKYNTI